MALPPVVTPAEWQAARDELLIEEKRMTRALDALAAKRRRLPMVRIEKDYVFEDERRQAVSLLDLFDGRRQLLVYHFMLGPNTDPQQPCVGCSSFTDNIGNLVHLRARDTTFALVSRTSQASIARLKARMGWTQPWYSSLGSDFNFDLGLSSDRGEMFGLSAFLRDGEAIYRTYFTSARGVDRLRMDFALLDLTALGRQEEWEDSPEGWPQTPTMQWLRRQDEYEAA
jgi:predicted dithiol-disulfide oxidoreductase (DUF899 family)